MILIETLGTNTEKPKIINDRMKEFFNILEDNFGFEKTVIRTDYCFNSAEEAHDILDFFFGDEIKPIKIDNRFIFPECTGIWWRTK